MFFSVKNLAVAVAISSLALAAAAVLHALADAGEVIVTVGYLTNMRNLLKSKPDRHSPLNGVDLVKKKVKRWVCMGLKIPKDREFNIFRDTSASIRLAYKIYTGLKDRPSWDQTAVLFAVRGPGDLWDVHSGGHAEVLPDGSNCWQDGPDRGRPPLRFGRHSRPYGSVVHPVDIAAQTLKFIGDMP